MSAAAIHYQTDEFAVADGTRLVWQSWSPEGEPVAVLAVVHGYGEHGGRYTFLVDALLPRGYAVISFDLRGHGRSPGPRGHIRRFDDYVADTSAFLAHVGRAFPGRPVVLLGHSMGGLIAAAFAEQEGKATQKIAGLVLSSPFIGVRLPVPAIQVKVARLLSRIAPSLRMTNPLRNEQLSHDPAVVAAAGTDPLNHRVTTVRWAAEILDAQRTVLSAAGSLRLPLLLLYADDDSIADPRTSEELFAGAASADKMKICYAGYYHEVFNDVGRAAVFDDLAGWLAARVAVART